MKYAAWMLLLLAGLAWPQEEEERPPEEGAEEEATEEEAPEEAAPPATVKDPQMLLNDLTLANVAKDVTRVDLVVKDIIDYGKATKDQTMADSLAKELTDSIKVCKGNWGTLAKVMEALGELRSKEGVRALRRVAFQKKADSEDEERVQGAAIIAIAKMADSRQINGIGDMCKSRSRIVAKAAYEAFQHYGPAKGKDRKKCAEILMKRLDAEYPAAGGQGSGKVSAEQQERWNELQPAIVASMQAIARENTINDIANWREWWKENKKSSKAWKDEDES